MRGANDAVRGKREPADERERCFDVVQGGRGFRELPREAGLHPRIISKRVLLILRR
jgi:hypothetical protein